MQQDFFDKYRQTSQTPAPAGDFFDKYRQQQAPPPPAQSVAVEPDESTFWKLAGPTLNNFNPLSILSGLGQTVLHPVNTVGKIFGPMQRWGNVDDALSQWRFTDAANEFAAGIPILGPIAEQASAKTKAGDWAGGMGDMLGGVTAFTLGPESVAGVLAKGAKAARLPSLPGKIAEFGIAPTKGMRKDFDIDDWGRAAMDYDVSNAAQAQERLTQVTNQFKQDVAASPAKVNSMDNAFKIAARAEEAGKVAGRGAKAPEAMNQIWGPGGYADRYFDRWGGGDISMPENLEEKIGTGYLAGGAWTAKRDPTSMDTVWDQATAMQDRQNLIDNVAGAEDSLRAQQTLLGLKTAFEEPRTAGLRHLIQGGLFSAGVLTGNPYIAGPIGGIALMQEIMKTPKGAITIAKAVEKTGKTLGNENLIRAMMANQQLQNNVYIDPAVFRRR